MKPPGPIHRLKGDPAPKLESWLKWPFIGLLVLLVAGLFLSSSLADAAVLGLRLGELFIALAVLGSALYGGAVYQDTRRLAERAQAESAQRDAFWAPEALKAQLAPQVEAYWRALAGLDATRLAGQLTEDWQAHVDERLHQWRQTGCRPVILDLSVGEIHVVGLEDWQENHRDRVTLRVDVQTSFHVTHLASGELVEGTAMSRPEPQLWHLARGEQGWLVDRVEIVAGAAAYRDCRVFQEAV